jgi:hypothetical protein
VPGFLGRFVGAFASHAGKWEIAMRANPSQRWVEQAEARSVRELALLQRAADEPHLIVTAVPPHPTGLTRLRSLVARIPAAVISEGTSPVRRRNSV